VFYDDSFDISLTELNIEFGARRELFSGCCNFTAGFDDCVATFENSFRIQGG